MKIISETTIELSKINDEAIIKQYKDDLNWFLTNESPGKIEFKHTSIYENAPTFHLINGAEDIPKRLILNN